jgi:molybdopterin converting factor small subunit
MKVTLEYTAQLRHAAGTRNEVLDLPPGMALRAALQQVAARHSAEFRQQLLASTGDIQPSLLLFHCDRQVAAGNDPVLSDCDTVTIMSPISGG